MSDRWLSPEHRQFRRQTRAVVHIPRQPRARRAPIHIATTTRALRPSTRLRVSEAADLTKELASRLRKAAHHAARQSAEDERRKNGQR